MTGGLGMGTEKTWHGFPDLRVKRQCNIVVGGVRGINEGGTRNSGRQGTEARF